MCYKKLRNTPEDQYAKLRISYEAPQVTIQYYNDEKKEFETCVVFEADLSF